MNIRRLSIPETLLKSVFPGFLFFCILSCSRNDNLNGIVKNNECVNLMDSSVELSDSILFPVDDSTVLADVICDPGLIIIPGDTLTLNDYPGTICCLYGPSQAEPGDTLVFEYNSGFLDSATTVTWDVLCGSMELIKGQDTPKATFVCKNDFNGGVVRGFGKKNSLECSDNIQVKLK